ncbi:MAG TPA: hypothetical protein DCE23_03500 [Firmicutes bacterium]|nr:hypothetical protein [Bacillota bacterium]
METKFNKQETIKLLEEYYQKLEGKKVKVSISAKSGTFGLYETKGCQTTITVTERMEIAGMNKDVSVTLPEEDLKRNLTALFALYDFDVKGVDIDDGLSSHWEGYGMMEHQVERAYFNGITVNLEKAKQKNLGMYYR